MKTLACTTVPLQEMTAPTWLLLIYYSLIKILLWELSPRKHVLHQKEMGNKCRYEVTTFSVLIFFAWTESNVCVRELIRVRHRKKTELERNSHSLWGFQQDSWRHNMMKYYIWWRACKDIFKVTSCHQQWQDKWHFVFRGHGFPIFRDV